MSAPSNHFKVGLFVLLAVAATLGAAIALGAASAGRKTVSYHTFFNESVQGLDLGSPVRYRGVIIGKVAAIEIAPDHRHVDVLAELDALIVTLKTVVGLTLVIVTHELASIFAIADRCILLDKETKSIIARGRPSELKESEDQRVSDFFNRRPRAA